MDNEQNNKQAETVVENNGGADDSQANQINSDKIAETLVEKMKNLFKKEKQEEKPDEPSPEVLELARKLAQDEVDKLAAKTKRKVTEDAQTTIEQERAALEAEKAAIQAQKKQLELDKQFITLNIDSKYQDYIKFEIEKSGKSLEDFIKDNPQFVAANAQPNRVVTNTVKSLNQKDIDYLNYVREREK